MLVGVCWRNNMEWGQQIFFVLTASKSCRQYFFPAYTEVFNPCKTCRAEGEVMLEWDCPHILCKKLLVLSLWTHLFSITLVRDRAEFAQPDLLIIQGPLIWRNHICVFSPAYFKAFHCLWGGRQWDEDPFYPLQCWWPVAIRPFVIEWVRICLCHCHMKTGTETSVIPPVETGAGRGW